MGLDVDLYRVRKENIKKDTDIWNDIIKNKNYAENVYMRKPYLIWYKVVDITHYKLSEHIFTKTELIKIKKELKQLLKNFKEIYKKEINLRGYDNYIYHLRKYVDFYDIITEVLNDENFVLILDYCS